LLTSISRVLAGLKTFSIITAVRRKENKRIIYLENERSRRIQGFIPIPYGSEDLSTPLPPHLFVVSLSTPSWELVVSYSCFFRGRIQAVCQRKIKV